MSVKPIAVTAFLCAFVVNCAYYLTLDEKAWASDEKGKIGQVKEIKSIVTINANVDGITCLAFTPDSKVLAAYNGDEDVIRFWDATTGRSNSEFSAGDPCGNGKIAFSSDGSLLASVHYGRKNLMILWDWKKKTVVAKLDGLRLPRSLAFSPDDNLLGVVADDNIYLFDVKKKEVVHKLPHKVGFQTHLAFSLDGKKAVVTSESGRDLHVIDCEKGREIKTLQVEGDSEYGCFWWATWMQDGKTVIVVGQREGISLWNTVSGKKTRQLTDSTNGINRMGSISPDGKYLAGESVRRELILWDLSTLKQTNFVKGRLPTFSPNGKFLATVSSDGIRILDVSTFQTTLDK